MPSKLGIHGIMPGSTVGAVQQLVAAGAHMATVKGVADPGWLSDIKALDPSIPTMGRFIHGADPNVNVEGPRLDGDLRETARKVMNSLLPKWERHREYVDYWEIINEQDPAGPEGQVRIAELMQHCMEIAEAEGYLLALFSYSLGVPEWEEWAAIVETGVFARAKAGGHVLSLHEYASPIDKWYGEPLPGRPTYPDRGPLACRYRWLYEDFLIPRDEVIPLYITESNVADDIPNLTAEEWIRQMAWYDTQLRKDYYVVGTHIFTLGSAGGWQNYDFENFMPQLVEYIISLKDVEDPTWPEEGTPPVEEEEKEGEGEGEKEREIITPGSGPREPFSRHYVLLPPGSNWVWIAALQTYVDAFRPTIGFSADDAGYGPGLEERIVTAINPDRWPTNLQAFFDTHYPGVRYDPVFAATPQALHRTMTARAQDDRRLG